MSAAADSNPPGELYCATCEKTFHTGERCPTDGARLIKIKAQLDPFLGRELDGRYTVLERLGQGGMGAVYRGEQHSVGREVAIKVVNTGLANDPDVIKRFLREARLASQFAHPNAVAVLDFGQTDDGMSYLVMELVRGRTLDEAMATEGVFSPERVIRIGTQILDALDAAHARSIIHRDLKPANVMLLSHGRDLVKVLDFGLAKSVSPDATSTTMTSAGAIVGTPSFMPPELATGQPCDGRADLYSLGCVLYLLGSGKLPFRSESVHELIAMHGSDEPAPPMPNVPPRLAMAIGRLLEKDPARRFQTAAEALHALESCVTVTPAGGVATWHDPTGTGPTPSGLAGMATPIPDSLYGGHDHARSNLAGERAVARSQGVTTPPPRRWPIVLAALVGAVVVAVVVFRVMGGAEPAAADDEHPVTDPVLLEPVSSGSAGIPEHVVAPDPLPDAGLAPPLPDATVESTEPVEPVVAKPDKPTRPHRPVHTARPDKPTKPDKPVQPVDKPDKPIKPDKPTNGSGTALPF